MNNVLIKNHIKQKGKYSRKHSGLIWYDGDRYPDGLKLTAFMTIYHTDDVAILKTSGSYLVCVSSPFIKLLLTPSFVTGDS